MEHTQGTWRVTGTGTIRYIDVSVGNCMVQEVATCMRTEYGDMEANARRIVACVNACAGLSTDLLEKAALTAAHIEARERLSFCTQQIEAERDQLQSQLEAERASLFAENQRKQQLEGQVEELVVALKFYADKQRYMGSNQRVEDPDIYGESPSNTVYLWDVMKDGGDIARAVIQKVRGGE